jgi:RING finger protein 113A
MENVAKRRKNIGGTIANANRDKAADGDDEDAVLENIPFACIFCKASYRELVVTKCGHYFSEPCAHRQYRKDLSCAACGAGTNGVFNSAKRLTKLPDKQQERAARRRQEAIEAGEEVSDEDEEAGESDDDDD